MEACQESVARDIEQRITFQLKDLDFESFKKALDAYGVVICRNAYPVAEVKKVRDLIFQQVFPRMRLGRDFREDLAKYETFPAGVKLKTLNFLLEGVLDMMELDRDKIFQTLVEQSGITPLIERYVSQGKVHSLTNYYYARTLDPLEQGFKLGYHQDGTFLRGLGDPRRFMICWNPLVCVNGNAPGLELVAKNFEAILETAKGQYHSVSMAQPEEFAAEYKDYIIRPNMKVGDFILFTPFVPHRTYITEGMTDIRSSIDFRFYCGDIKDLGKINTVKY